MLWYNYQPILRLLRLMIRRFFYLFLLFILLSCCSREKINIICYDLKRIDFVEKINAKGTIQAINTLTIVTPGTYYSNISVRHLVDDGTYVKKGDTICILDVPELINDFEAYTTSLEITKADMKKLEAENVMNMSLLQAQIENNEADVALNSLDSIQQKFAPPVKQKLFALELEKADVVKNKLRKKYAAQKKIEEAELRSMKSRITQSENQIKGIKDQINSLTIVAPRDGITMHTETPILMFFNGIGGGTAGGKIEENSSVWPNMALLQMPDMSQMQLSVEVPEGDYKRIDTGQIVFISVDAVKNLNTTGKIKKKTLVGQQEDNQTSVKTYEVIVSIDSCHSLMKPGLSAGCKIIINEVKDTVVVPTLAIFEQDSTKIIYVAREGKFVIVPVETGLSNSSETIIAKGLTSDETIALVEPPHQLIVRKGKTIKNIITISDSIKTDTLIKRHP
jgi:multidrug efflux pump subunit AcrA (membrane-fusion protein)